jgi:osmotically-inducible protein OsmY
VKSIKNEIIVKQITPIKLDTMAIKSKISKEFERHARIDAKSIKIKVKGNKIILKGTVRNFDEMNEAEEAACSVVGVEEVENHLRIEY